MGGKPGSTQFQTARLSFWMFFSLRPAGSTACRWKWPPVPHQFELPRRPGKQALYVTRTGSGCDGTFFFRLFMWSIWFLACPEGVSVCIRRTVAWRRPVWPRTPLSGICDEFKHNQHFNVRTPVPSSLSRHHQHGGEWALQANEEMTRNRPASLEPQHWRAKQWCRPQWQS